jgi:hypothetical protein
LKPRAWKWLLVAAVGLVVLYILLKKAGSDTSTAVGLDGISAGGSGGGGSAGIGGVVSAAPAKIVKTMPTGPGIGVPGGSGPATGGYGREALNANRALADSILGSELARVRTLAA